MLLIVVSDLVVSVILVWDKLDIDMRNSTSIKIFKKSLLQFVRRQTIILEPIQLPYL